MKFKYKLVCPILYVHIKPYVRFLCGNQKRNPHSSETTQVNERVYIFGWIAPVLYCKSDLLSVSLKTSTKQVCYNMCCVTSCPSFCSNNGYHVSLLACFCVPALVTNSLLSNS